MNMILYFFSRLGIECSLFENCARISFPEDFLWCGLVMILALGLSTYLRPA